LATGEQLKAHPIAAIYHLSDSLLSNFPHIFNPV